MAKAKMRKRQSRKHAARKASSKKPKTWGIQIYRDNWPGFDSADAADILNQHVGGVIKNGRTQLHVWEQPRWGMVPQVTSEVEIIICPSFPCTG